VDEMGLRDGLINLGCEPEDSEAASELVAQDAEEGIITRALLEETIRMAENAKDEEEEDSGATKALRPAKSNRPLSPYKRNMVMREMPPQVLAMGNKKGDLQAMLTIHVAIERLRRGARILELIKSRSVEGILIDDLDMAKHEMHVEIDSIPAHEREPAAILIQSVLRGRRKRRAIEEAKATGGSIISAPQVVTVSPIRRFERLWFRVCSGLDVGDMEMKKQLLPDPSISHWSPCFPRRKQSSGAFLRIVSQNDCHSDRQCLFAHQNAEGMGVSGKR
jgi:hypothetical protein